MLFEVVDDSVNENVSESDAEMLCDDETLAVALSETDGVEDALSVDVSDELFVVDAVSDSEAVGVTVSVAVVESVCDKVAVALAEPDAVADSDTDIDAEAD